MTGAEFKWKKPWGHPKAALQTFGFLLLPKDHPVELRGVAWVGVQPADPRPNVQNRLHKMGYIHWQWLRKEFGANKPCNEWNKMIFKKNVSACLSFLSPSRFPAFPANSLSKSMTALPASAVALMQMPVPFGHRALQNKRGVRRVANPPNDFSAFTTAIHLHCLILSWLKWITPAKWPPDLWENPIQGYDICPTCRRRRRRTSRFDVWKATACHVNYGMQWGDELTPTTPWRNSDFKRCHSLSISRTKMHGASSVTDEIQWFEATASHHGNRSGRFSC